MIWCNTFPKLIKEEWIRAASVAAVNFHSAPLPEYRGVFAFNFAILNGDGEYGVTAHLLGKKFDQGDIIEVRRFPYDCGKGSVAELVALSEEKMLEPCSGIVTRSTASGGACSHDAAGADGGRYFSRSDFEEAKRIVPGEDPAMTERRVRAFWYPPYEGAYVEAGGTRYAVVSKEVLDALGARR